MKRILTAFLLISVLSGCQLRDKEEGSSTPMIERQHSYMQKTQAENMKEIDTTDTDNWF